MKNIVRTTINPGQKPTAEQIREVEEASRHPIVFDDDSPEFAYEEILRMVKETKATHT